MPSHPVRLDGKLASSCGQSGIRCGLLGLGRKCALIGCVCDDEIGSWITETLMAQGGDVKFVRRVVNAKRRRPCCCRIPPTMRAVSSALGASAGSRMDLFDINRPPIRVTPKAPHPAACWRYGGCISSESPRVWWRLSNQ